MTRRRSNKKKKLTEKAIANSDEPPDFGITALVLGITGVVLAATGTTLGAVSAHQNAKMSASMAESNAMAQQRDADFARNTAAYNETLARQRADRVRGSQRAAIGASGLDYSGSPLDLLEETTTQSEIEALAIRRQGQFSAGGSEFGAAGSRLQADAYRRSGKTQLTSGLVSAGGQLAGGLATAGANYKTMTNPGTY